MTRKKERYRDLVKTPWGWVGTIYSHRGLQGLILPRETRQEAEELLEKNFGAGAGNRPWRELRAQLREWFDKGGGNLSLPLDISPPGAFTARVWEEAVKIPPGETATYGEIAARAGRRGAARAVGQAMRRNPVPLAIPCHRVVRKEGPGGFMGNPSPGLKTRMLALEKNGAEGERALRRGKGGGRCEP
jgi:methylated-DNA-[protein]-cysteine S-methyltransferase